MEYREIIQNILTKQETITQCHNTLEKLEANNAPTSELLHVSRFLALEKVDLINYANATETVKEIVNELNTIATLSDNEDTTISLQVSGIIDSVLQKLSKQELKIYIYRYFFFSSIDGIGKLCNCSTNHVTKTLSYINATLKAEIIKANVTCCTKTLLKSFADIDEENLTIALSNINKEYESSDDNTGKKTASKKTSKSRNIPWNKLTNFAFVIILIISILANIYLAKNGFNSANSSSDNNEQTQIKQHNEYEGLITNIKGTETVNINKLLSYQTKEDISDSEFFYESEHFIGFYYALPLKSSVPLADCAGAELEEYRQDKKNYYTLKGLNGLQYVIKKSYDTYYLLVLSHISPKNNLEEPLTNVAYLEIWRDFYGSAYSDQIEKITVQHGSTNLNFNDTNVKKLIDNSDDINDIFTILINSEYSGDPYDNSLNTSFTSHEHLMETSVQLLIEKEDGTIIDTIYYRPEYHYFFDSYSFIAFAPSQEYEGAYFEPADGESQTGIFIDNTTNTNYQGKYLDSMLAFTHHNAKPVDPDKWNIDISSFNAGASYISLSVNQASNAKPINGLYIGEDFILEIFENDQWVELPINNGHSSQKPSPFYTHIDALGAVTTEHFYITNKYNRPSVTGKYRLTITVYDSNSNDLNNPASRNYSIEFHLDESYFN